MLALQITAIIACSLCLLIQLVIAIGSDEEAVTRLSIATMLGVAFAIVVLALSIGANA